MQRTPKQQKARARAVLKDRVKRVCRRLIARGVIPSEKILRDEIPGHGATLLAQLRNELRESGHLPDWSHLRVRGFGVSAIGLTGRTAAQQQEIAAAIAEVLREKIKAGPPNCPDRPLRELVARTHVYHDPEL